MAATATTMDTSMQSLYSFNEKQNCSTEFHGTDTSDDESDDFQDKIKRGSFVSSESFQ